MPIILGGVASLEPTAAVFYDHTHADSSMPSLVEALDHLCIENPAVLKLEEIISGMNERSTRFLEVFALFQRAVRNEALSNRKFKKVKAKVTRWSTNV
jgi:hypothetical protein